MKSVLVLAISLFAFPASAATLSFNLDPPLSVFSGSLGMFASASYLETIADGSPCWWLFVGAYNAAQPPQPTPLAYEPLSPPVYVDPPVWTPPGHGGSPTAVPEPSTALLALIGFASLFLGRRIIPCGALR